MHLCFLAEYYSHLGLCSRHLKVLVENMLDDLDLRASVVRRMGLRTPLSERSKSSTSAWHTSDVVRSGS